MLFLCLYFIVWMDDYLFFISIHLGLLQMILLADLSLVQYGCIVSLMMTIVFWCFGRKARGEDGRAVFSIVYDSEGRE